MKTTTKYLCRIHTKQYAGNFHRELGMYITGFPDDTISLEPEDLEKETDGWFECLVPYIHPEYGMQNCPMLDGKDGYNSVELAFEENPPQNIRDFIAKRVERFAQGDCRDRRPMLRDGGIGRRT